MYVDIYKDPLTIIIRALQPNSVYLNARLHAHVFRNTHALSIHTTHSYKHTYIQPATILCECACARFGSQHRRVCWKPSFHTWRHPRSMASTQRAPAIHVSPHTPSAASDTNCFCCIMLPRAAIGWTQLRSKNISTNCEIFWNQWQLQPVHSLKTCKSLFFMFEHSQVVHKTKNWSN